MTYISKVFRIIISSRNSVGPNLAYVSLNSLLRCELMVTFSVISRYATNTIIAMSNLSRLDRPAPKNMINSVTASNVWSR